MKYYSVYHRLTQVLVKTTNDTTELNEFCPVYFEVVLTY